MTVSRRSGLGLHTLDSRLALSAPRRGVYNAAHATFISGYTEATAGGGKEAYDSATRTDEHTEQRELPTQSAGGCPR